MLFREDDPDFTLIWRDDWLLDDLGAGQPPELDDLDSVGRLLLAWRCRVDAEPIRLTLVDKLVVPDWEVRRRGG